MPTIAKHKDRTDKTKQAYDFFIGRGYTPEQASGIVGNLLKESNLSTSAEGDVGYSGGSSLGIAQWRGERLKNLQSRYGNKWKDFNSQLEFIDWELNNTEKKAGQALKNSKDVFEAGAVISDLYERPKVKFNQDKNRQNHVLNTYKKLANSEYQGEPITTDVNNLEFTQATPTFAGVPDVEVAEKREEDKDVEEVKQQTAEYNFLQEIQNTPEREQLAQQEQPQQRQQIENPNYLEQFQQISQFVDSPLLAQQGGTWQEQQEKVKAEKLAKLRELLKDKNVVKNLEKEALQRRGQLPTERTVAQVDATKTARTNNPDKTSTTARNKTDKEIAEERQARIDAQTQANAKPFDWSNFRQSLADRSQATGDALRVSNEPNLFDDYLNPASMIGSMADNLGQAPLRAQQEDSYMPYVTAVGTPLAVGALAGVGTNSTGQFVNNLANPLAGIRTSIPDELRQGLRTQGFSLNPKFKSEIDWAKWNKEIPENKALMNEYNAIEQKAKEEGTWMKDKRKVVDDEKTKALYEEGRAKIETEEKDKLLNSNFDEYFKNASNQWKKNFESDPESKLEFLQIKGVDTKKINEALEPLSSSIKNREKELLTKNETAYKTTLEDFKGTPEQFVQQNSENFKKAYPNGVEKVYRGSYGEMNTERLAELYPEGRGIFTGDFKTGRHYTTPEGKFNELYHPASSNSYNINAKGNSWRDVPIENLPNMKSDRSFIGNPVATTDDIATWAEKANADYVNINNVFDGTNAEFVRIINNKPGNYLKSAIGNNGMFDLSNPNIYKSVVPVAGTSYLATQGQGNEEQTPQYQQGGEFSQAELAFLSEIAIKDNEGYRNPTNKNKIVEINSPSISMKGIKQPIIAISKQTGEKKKLKPEQEVVFKNTSQVIEIPFFKNK